MNDKDKDEWGNIELPGFGDELLLSPNLNKILAARARAKDPQWRANQKAAAEKRAQDPDWIANHKAANQALAQDPEWQVKVKAAAEKRAQDPEWLAKNKTVAEKRAQDPDWQANQKAATKLALSKPIQGTNKITGEVRVWNSSMDASRELKHSNGNISQAANGKKKSAAGFFWKYLDGNK